MLLTSIRPVENTTTCKFCNKPATARCAVCRATYYCTAVCQRLDWPSHKLTCAKELVTPTPADMPTTPVASVPYTPLTSTQNPVRVFFRNSLSR
jgi:hypothetical protein